MAGIPPRSGPVTGLAGREREIGELRGLARGGTLLTLLGAAGSGKTRLLKALLAALAGEFPDGIFRVDVGDLRSSDLVAARVAAALRVPAEPGVPLAGTLARALRGRRAVVALDSCERVAGACGDLGRRLLADSPDLLVVAASREALGASGETVWPVPPLARPAAGERVPARAARCAAVGLFVARAGTGFVLDEASCPAVAAICAAAGGLPLAIELAAARTGDRSAGQIADGLRDLAPGGAAPGGVIGWSYGLLEPDEQVLLRRLSVLAGWTTEIAERVCADDARSAARVGGLLSRLAGWSLVEVRPEGSGPARYRLPRAVRDVAAQRLAAAGETAAIRRRLRDYVTHLADYIASIGTVRVPVTWPVLTEVFRTYEAQASNIRAVLAWCLEDGDAETGLRICAAVRLCWDVRGAVSEGIRWLDAFLDASPPGIPAVVRGPALVARAQLALAAGDRPQAQAQAAAGLELCQAADDPRPAAAALGVLARTALAAGQPETALRLAGDALELTGRSRDWWNRGYALGDMSAALTALGRLAEARQRAEAGLALMTEIDHQWGAAMFRVTLGDLARRTGDLDAARASYLAALPLVREMMPAPETVRCLARLGSTALQQGDLVAARDYLAERLQLSLAAGGRAGVAGSLAAVADLAVREGRPDRAVTLMAAATALSQAAHRPPPRPDQTQRCLDAAAGLGAAQTARLWAAGLCLSSQEAARLALRRPDGPDG